MKRKLLTIALSLLLICSTAFEVSATECFSIQLAVTPTVIQQGQPGVFSFTVTSCAGTIERNLQVAFYIRAECPDGSGGIIYTFLTSQQMDHIDIPAGGQFNFSYSFTAPPPECGEWYAYVVVKTHSGAGYTQVSTEFVIQ